MWDRFPPSQSRPGPVEAPLTVFCFFCCALHTAVLVYVPVLCCKHHTSPQTLCALMWLRYNSSRASRFSPFCDSHECGASACVCVYACVCECMRVCHPGTLQVARRNREHMVRRNFSFLFFFLAVLSVSCWARHNTTPSSKPFIRFGSHGTTAAALQGTPFVTATSARVCAVLDTTWTIPAHTPSEFRRHSRSTQDGPTPAVQQSVEPSIGSRVHIVCSDVCGAPFRPATPPGVSSQQQAFMYASSYALPSIYIGRGEKLSRFLPTIHTFARKF